jgi:hypothetical protein
MPRQILRYAIGRAKQLVTGDARAASNGPFSPLPERDIYLVSYPRSGNTWMRAVIACMVTGQKPGTLASLDTIVPDIHFRLPQSSMMDLPQYVVKSHFPYQAEYRRVIYVLRDPKKVLASHYDYLTQRHRQHVSIERFADDWLAGRIWPCSWIEHVRSWLFRDTFAPQTLLALNYEDILNSRLSAFARIADFIGIDAGKMCLDRIVAWTDRISMLKMEVAGARVDEESKVAMIGGAEINRLRTPIPTQVADQVDRECGAIWRRAQRIVAEQAAAHLHEHSVRPY